VGEATVRILVTGASGFIGSRVATALRSAGHQVFGLARTAQSVAKLEATGLGRILGDLARPAQLATPLEELKPDAVVHSAAETATQRSARLIQAVNVDGTRALAEACRGLALERFVFLSSVVVGQPRGALLREDEPLIPTTAYGRSKVEGEALLRREAEKHGLPLVVLRPSHVYGPGGWFAEIVRDLERRRFLIPGDGENLWDVVHVDDVVDATRRLVETPLDARDGHLFHAVDDTPVTLNRFIARTCVELGRPAPWHIPVFAARVIAGRGPVDAAVRSARSSNGRLRERLGWSPRFPSFETGVPASVLALRQAGQR
jgi:nucleoside-diphosphate-sugar epimerase